jgi:hypothetical protein
MTEIESPSEILISYLKEVVKGIPEFDRSKFIRFHYEDGNDEQREAFVYPNLLKRENKINYFHDNLAQLTYISKRLGESRGLKLGLPNTHAIKGISLSPETKEFRGINPSFTLMSNLLVRRLPRRYEVIEIRDADFTDIEDNPKKSEKVNPRKDLGTILHFEPRILSREMPPIITSYFDKFKGPIPDVSELERCARDWKCLWDGYRHDANGLSSVKASFDGIKLNFSAESCEGTKAGLAYYTEENPHK